MTEVKTRNLTTLAKSIHEAAKAKGFWDETRDLGETFMLMISEAAEAMEGHRKGKAADLAGFDENISSELLELVDNKIPIAVSMFKSRFEEHIKDSFEDELADVVIRCLDFAGFKQFEESGFDFGRTNEFTEPDYATKSNNVGSQLLKISSLIMSAYDYFEDNDEYYGAVALCDAISKCYTVAEKNGFDLDRHIELKLKYNATRPYKHGKKY